MRIYVEVAYWEKTEFKGALAVLSKMPTGIKDPHDLVGKEVRPIKGRFKKYMVEQVMGTDPVTLRAVLIPWPACNPAKKKYSDIHTAHRTLKYLEKKLARTMDMYECDDHWHVIVDKNELSREEYVRKYMNDLRKSTRTNYRTT